MSDAPITLEELRTVDLFDELTDEELAQWVALARPRHVAPGEIIAEQGEEPPGLQLLLEGNAQALILADGRSEPVGRHRAPTWMGAISVLTGHSLGVRMLAETACRVAIVAPEDFRRLAFAQPAVNQRVMQQVGPVDQPRHGHRAEPRGAWPHWARWRQGWPTSSTTRRRLRVVPPSR